MAKKNENRCIVTDCDQPIAGEKDRIPGTAQHGSKIMCVQHEGERIKRISKSFEDLAKDFGLDV